MLGVSYHGAAGLCLWANRRSQGKLIVCFRACRDGAIEPPSPGTKWLGKLLSRKETSWNAGQYQSA
jgi:hypothetical protein